VHNAGVEPHFAITDLDFATWDQTYAVNIYPIPATSSHAPTGAAAINTEPDNATTEPEDTCPKRDCRSSPRCLLPTGELPQVWTLGQSVLDV